METIREEQINRASRQLFEQQEAYLLELIQRAQASGARFVTLPTHWEVGTEEVPTAPADPYRVRYTLRPARCGVFDLVDIQRALRASTVTFKPIG